MRFVKLGVLNVIWFSYFSIRRFLVMFRVSILFFATALLTLAFALFVPASTTMVSVELFSRVYIYPIQQVFKLLSLLAFGFGILYHFTESFLFSFRWSVMHLLCFICLLINVWTLGILERVLLLSATDSTIENVEAMAGQQRFDKIQRFYSGSLLLLLFMQLSYILNLGIGLFRRNSRT